MDAVEAPGARQTSVAELARRCLLHEEAGELREAIECAERWLQASPADPDAARRLVDLLLQDSEIDRAGAAIAAARAHGLAPDVAEELQALVAASAGRLDEDDPEAPPPMAADPTDAEVLRFLQAFSGRENVYARQWWNESGEGGYSPVREPLSFRVVRQHLLGSITVGVYVVRLDDTVNFLAFDLDIAKRALRAARSNLAEARRLRELAARESLAMQARLAELGVPSLLEDSGYKGRHLWVLFERPVEAVVARQFGSLFLARHRPSAGELSVELFPRQATTQGGVGNLIKLPLGIHRRTGRRSRFLAADGSPDPDPHGTLRAIPRLDRATLERAIQELSRYAADQAPVVSAVGEPAPDDGGPRPLPAPPAPPPAWTEADFERDPEIAPILRGCAVLDRLRWQVQHHRRLSHDEQVVLMHALGHSGPGVRAVNHLLDACVEVRPEARLQSPLAGNPISCSKIRKRLPHIAGAVPCDCVFPHAAGRYPTPRLHALAPGAQTRVAPGPDPRSEQPPWDPVERARTLGVLWARRDSLLAEIEELETRLARHLEASGGELDTGDGTLKLVAEPGCAPALVWHPHPKPAPCPP
jgi:hypothetical protein